MKLELVDMERQNITICPPPASGRCHLIGRPQVYSLDYIHQSRHLQTTNIPYSSCKAIKNNFHSDIIPFDRTGAQPMNPDIENDTPQFY